MLPCLIILNSDNAEYVQSLYRLFDQLKAMIDETPSEERRVSLPGMDEITAVYSHDIIYHKMITIASRTKSEAMFDSLCDYIDVMSADARFALMSELVHNITNKKQRDVVLKAAGDKSDGVRNIAFKALKNIKLTENEYLELEGMLRFKTESLRKNVIVLLLEQNPQACVNSVRRLAASEDANCRLAAKQLALDMKNNPAFQDVIRDAFRIAGIENTEPAESFYDAAENGYGLFDPKKLKKFELPPCPDIKLSDVIPDFEALMDKLRKLSALVEENKEYTYEVIHPNDSRTQVVFGTEYIHANKYEPQKIPLHDLFIPEVNKLFPGRELIKAVFLDIFRYYYYNDSSCCQKFSALRNCFPKLPNSIKSHTIVPISLHT